MGYKQISRDISQIDKKGMMRILNKYTNGTVILTSILGNAETFQFATKLKEVFESAGWKVDGVNQSVFSKPIDGIHIEIKTPKFPLKSNLIFDAFKVLNIVATGHINPNLGDDDVQVIIGAHK